MREKIILNTVIVDDEKTTISMLKLMVSQNPNLNCIGAFFDSKEAYLKIISDKPDLVFLDIEMPGINGIELAREIKKYSEDIHIVFTTAYECYAVDAFNVNALHYLIKPIKKEDIDTVVYRIRKTYFNSSIKSSRTISSGCRVITLGNYSVYGSNNGMLVEWPTQKVEELFAYFIYRNGKSTQKWVLWDMLWPERDEEKAKHNFHTSVYRIKESLKKVGYNIKIKKRNNSYLVETDGIYCDAYEFEAFIKRNLPVNEKNIEEYERIVSLYNGEPFQGKDYIWCIHWQEEILKQYIILKKKLSRYYLENNLPLLAETKLKKILNRNPFEEEANEMIMQVYFETGDKIKLMNHYDKLSKSLMEEFGTPPSLRTQDLYRNLIGML